MSVKKDIEELLEAGVINQEGADKIQEYYKSKSGNSTNRLFVVFGILGSILVGLGIILIIAHNWDQLPRTVKTIFALLPLVLSQGLCLYVILKKSENQTWRESATALLFFSIGASISLISQIYHIDGDLTGFLLTWMLLSLPLIYVMRSSMGSILYLVGITYYAVESGYWSYPKEEPLIYWLLFAAALPHYYFLSKNRPGGNFMSFHNWLIPLSAVISLGTVANRVEEIMFIAYFSLFGLMYLIGETPFFAQQKFRNNGYKILGISGTILMLFNISFHWFWEELLRNTFYASELLNSPEFIVASLISLLAIGLLYRNQKGKPIVTLKPLALVFLLFIPLFILGQYTSSVVVIINLLILAIGVLTINDGARQNHLGILNFGLLIITALVICRFFDTDLSFIVRGVLFVSVGVGFFMANYRMLKKRKADEE